MIIRSHQAVLFSIDSKEVWVTNSGVGIPFAMSRVRYKELQGLFLPIIMW